MSQQRRNQIPLSIKALRLGFRALYRVWPAMAARVTTSFFLRTRSKPRPADQQPLGPVPLEVDIPELGNVHVWGKTGPRALLVHGWGADSNTLFSMAEQLSNAGYQAVTFDAPNHGSAPGPNRTTMTDFSEGVRQLAEELGPLELVVAHSLGGIAAVSGLVREALPSRMVLISTPCDLPLILERWSDFFHIPKPLRAGMREQLLQRNGVPVEHWDLRERGRTLNCPVLVLQGEKDLLVPPEEAEKIAETLPNARARREPNLGHQRILMDRRVQKTIVEFAREGFDSEPSGNETRTERAASHANAAPAQ